MATTLTNPDQAVSTVSLAAVSSASATVTAVPLPSGLPARIYPADGSVNADEVDGYTAVAILFDSTLGWQFVATHTDSAAQIIAYFPACLKAALNISGMYL